MPTANNPSQYVWCVHYYEATLVMQKKQNKNF